MFLDTFISEENDGVLYIFQKKPPKNKTKQNQKKTNREKLLFFHADKVVFI